jgi:hypothetical protein
MRVPGLIFALLLVLCDAAGLAAQRVQGSLMDAESGAGIGGATVLLVDDDGTTVSQTVSDSRGGFSLRAPRPGLYRLRASRLGYREGISQPVDLVANGVVSVELRMSTGAVVLDPLTVTGIPRHERLEESGFYERRERFGPDGLKEAVFLEQHDIERMNPFGVNDIFQNVRGVRTDRGGLTMRLGCSPAIVIDGVTARRGSSRTSYQTVMPAGNVMHREVASPRSLVGVEVYYGYAIPDRYLLDAGGCGVIMMWTK